MSEQEAEAEARRLFGAMAKLEEECRDKRRTRWLDDFMQDLLFAWRSFVVKSPGFTTVAVLTLALGIGANTAFFSAAYGILLRSLPYPASGRLVDLQQGIGGVGPITSRVKLPTKLIMPGTSNLGIELASIRCWGSIESGCDNRHVEPRASVGSRAGTLPLV